MCLYGDVWYGGASKMSAPARARGIGKFRSFFILMHACLPSWATCSFLLIYCAPVWLLFQVLKKTCSDMEKLLFLSILLAYQARCYGIPSRKTGRFFVHSVKQVYVKRINLLCPIHNFLYLSTSFYILICDYLFNLFHCSATSKPRIGPAYQVVRVGDSANITCAVSDGSIALIDW